MDTERPASDTLAAALPREMVRVTKIAGQYRQVEMGFIAAALMEGGRRACARGDRVRRCRRDASDPPRTEGVRAVSKRAPKLPPPTMQERADAAMASRALAAVVADPSTRGERSVAFLDFSNPRRGECHIVWSNLPGFLQVNDRYHHACLPGWEYSKAEIEAEMIPDLRALAEYGVRPCEVTAGATVSMDLFGWQP